jgi:RNA polymerase sigma-70 factor, ECF subfamily
MIDRLAGALGDRYPAAAAAGLAERLAAGVAAARARWPPAPAAGAASADHVAGRLAPHADLAAAVVRLHVEDLFLAWWASTGDSAGIAAFEAAFAEDVALLVRRFHKLPAEDLRQRLRIKLFVGGPTAAPSIHGYSGAGSLQGWLRVTAARSFVDASRRDLRLRYDADLDDLDELDELGIAALAGTPHDRRAEAELTAAIKRAFAGAIAGLAPRERTFLRHATCDGLTLDQIAATYQVHRATVARTLKAARERMLAETRAGVIAELGIDPAQLHSALAVLDSKLDLSLSRVLRRD